MAAIDYGTGPNTNTGDLMPAALAKLKARLAARGFDPGTLGADIASALAQIEYAAQLAEAAYIPGSELLLTITGTPGPATVGTPYSFIPSVAYATGTVTFTLTGTLPAGLTFNTTTGAITGTPTAAASFTGSIGAVDSKSSKLLAVSFSVSSGSGAITLNALTVSNPTATVGTPYSGTISGLTSGSSVALSGPGAAGLSIGGAVISGTPTAAGAINLVETLAGATNSPRTSAGVAAVNAAGVPTITFANPTATVAEGNTGTTTVTNVINVTRNGVTGPLTINLTYGGTATSGTDYVAGPVSATIADGANSASFDLTINGDTAVESNETIIINAVLAAYTGSTASKTITILNDDAWASNVNLVIAGNSFIANTDLPTQIQALAPIAGSGCQVTVLGHGGYSWAQLSGVASEVDAAFVGGKINVLLVGETTNEVFNSPQTSAANTIADAKAYIAARKAAHSWDRVVVFGTIPRQDIVNTPAQTVPLNAVMNAVDADMAANISAYGADMFVNVRKGNVYDISDYSDATFNTLNAYYRDTPHVHPTTAVGTVLIAKNIASGLGGLALPASLKLLALSGALKAGAPSSGTISNATAGSSIVSNVAGLTVNSADRTYSWDGTGAAGTTANGLVETLAGAVGSPSSTPITVAAAGATVNYLRATTLRNMTETADGSGYDYTATAAGGYGSPYANGVCAQHLPAGADGWVAMPIQALVPAGQMLSVATVANPTSYRQSIFSVYADTTNGATKYSTLINFAGTNPNPNSPTMQVGDIVRIRRAGTTAYIEASQDGGATWIVMTTGSCTTVQWSIIIETGTTAAGGKVTQPFASSNVA